MVSCEVWSWRGLGVRCLIWTDVELDTVGLERHHHHPTNDTVFSHEMIVMNTLSSIL